MKRKRLLLLFASTCLILALAVSPFMAACAEPAPPAVAPEVTALEKEVAALEKKVATAEKGEAALEKEIAALKKEIAKAEAVVPVAPVVPTTPVEVITLKAFEQQFIGSNWQNKPEIVEEFLKRIETGTEGRVKIEWFFQGEHPYKSSDMLKALEAGVCDIVMIGNRIAGDEPLHRATNVTAFPFLIPRGDYAYCKEVNYWMRDEGIYDEILERWNGKMLINYFWAGQNIFMKDIPITGPDSLKGKKVRVAGASRAAVVEIMGGEPVYVDWGEVYTALATGLADGFQSSFPASLGMGYIELTPYICWMNMCYSGNQMVAHQDSWAALPADARDILFKTLLDLEDWYCDGDVAATLGVLEGALFDLNLKISTLPLDWRAEIRAQCFENVWTPEVEAGGERGWELFNKIAKKLIADGYDVPGYTVK